MNISSVFDYWNTPYSPVHTDDQAKTIEEVLANSDYEEKATSLCRRPSISSCGCAAYLFALMAISVTSFVLQLITPYCFAWGDYRLSDAVRQTNRRVHWYNEYKERFPYSVATQFLKTHHSNRPYSNMTAEEIKDMTDIAMRYQVATIDTLVVHLRIGDVLQQRSPQKVWQSETTTDYVFGRRHYESLNLPKNTRSVVIVASDNHHYTALRHKKSAEYMDTFQEWVQNKYPNASVWWRGNRNTPDSDFAYMCTAHHFIQGGGGYSRLVSEVVRQRGGVVYSSA